MDSKKKRRQKTALANLLKGTKNPSKKAVRTEEQKQQEIETLKKRTA